MPTPIVQPGLEAYVEQAVAASNERIVITGAGGWLGLATLELLKQALGAGFAQRIVCFGSSRRTLQLLDGSAIEQRPLGELAFLEPRPTILLHLAFLTKDRAEAMDEDDYVAANRQLSQMVLDALDRIGAETVFVASSGAATRADDPTASPAMRLYGRLKREDEDAFAAWAQQRGKGAVITRIFNLSGPHINKHHSYALASFILDALAGRPIEVRASHPVIRGYVAIRELMSLVFAQLLDGRGGIRRFETGGEPVELGEIAEAVRRALGGGPVERPTIQAGAVDRYAGDDRAYRALLAERGIEPVPFSQQVAETADFLSYFQSLQQSNGVAMEFRKC